MAEKKKSTILKDALILFAITLISGFLLGFSNDLTKDVIARNRAESVLKLNREVYPDAASFEEYDGFSPASFEELYAASGKEFGEVSVDEVLRAVDAGGNQLGWLLSASSQDAYGGTLSIKLGVTLEGEITGIGLLEINESPGLGDNAKKPEFLNQYVGKTVPEFSVTKQGAVSDEEIDAISGATRTSRAVTNAVNAALLLLTELNQ